MVVASVGLVNQCSKLSGYISWILNKIPDTDDTIGVLRVEIDSLSRASGSIGVSFADPALAGLTLALQTGYEAQHWENAKRTMDDCKETMEGMYQVLQRACKVKRRGVFQKSINQFEPDELSSKAIEIWKQQIMAYRKAMEISFQLVYMYSPPLPVVC